MRHIIKKLLNEITFGKPDREKFGWRYVQTKKSPDKKTHISTFRTPTYKYIVEAEEYKNHFYFISFYPSLDQSYESKQYRLMMSNQKYSDKYTFRTNEKVITKDDQIKMLKMSKKEKDEYLKTLPSMFNKILSLILYYMDEILEKDPLASFGYFGAPNIKGVNKNPDEDFKNSQRFIVWRSILNQRYKDTHNPYHEEKFSASLYINKEVEKEFPGILKYGEDIIASHL